MKRDLNTILNLFCSEDKYKKDALGKPSRQGDYYYASCGHSLVKISRFIEDLGIENNSQAPNFESVIPSINTKDEITWDLEKLSGELQRRVPKVKAYRECVYCDGEGKQECNLGHTHTCTHCEDGKETIYPLMEINDPECLIKFGEVYFRYVLLERMIHCFRLLGRKEVVWSNRERVAANLFTMDMLILIMPVNITSEEELRKEDRNFIVLEKEFYETT